MPRFSLPHRWIKNPDENLNPGFVQDNFEAVEDGVNRALIGAGMTYVGAFTNNTTTLDFTNIPQTYKHLRVFWIAQSNRAGLQNTGTVIRMNGLSSAFYTRMYYIPGGLGGASTRLQTSWYVGQIPANNRTNDNYVSMFTIDFPFYSSTTVNKTMMGQSGGDDGTNALGSTFNGANISTAAAITSLTLQDDVGANLGPRARAELWAS